MNRHYYVYLDQLELQYHSDSVRGYNLENSYIELTIEVATDKTLSSDDPIITQKAEAYAYRAWRVTLTGFSVGEFWEMDYDTGEPIASVTCGFNSNACDTANTVHSEIDKGQ